MKKLKDLTVKPSDRLTVSDISKIIQIDLDERLEKDGTTVMVVLDRDINRIRYYSSTSDGSIENIERILKKMDDLKAYVVERAKNNHNEISSFYKWEE